MSKSIEERMQVLRAQGRAQFKSNIRSLFSRGSKNNGAQGIEEKVADKPYISSGNYLATHDKLRSIRSEVVRSLHPIHDSGFTAFTAFCAGIGTGMVFGPKGKNRLYKTSGGEEVPILQVVTDKKSALGVSYDPIKEEYVILEMYPFYRKKLVRRGTDNAGGGPRYKEKDANRVFPEWVIRLKPDHFDLGKVLVRYKNEDDVVDHVLDRVARGMLNESSRLPGRLAKIFLPLALIGLGTISELHSDIQKQNSSVHDQNIEMGITGLE